MKHEKNKKVPTSNPENYDLKIDAVEVLASADAENVPQYSKEELKKYRGRQGLHIPNPRGRRNKPHLQTRL